MEGSLERVSDENPDSSFVVYGSYIENGEEANDLDVLILVSSREEVEDIDQSLRSEDWSIPLDTEFFFREKFWDWVEHKDFKFATAFEDEYELYGRPIDEEEVKDLLHEKTPEKEDIEFNFYRSVDAWDKARIFLEDAKNYSRREMSFDDDFSPEMVFQNNFNETGSQVVVDALQNSSGALSISAGYLAGVNAYLEGEESYTMNAAINSPDSEIDEIFQQIRALNQEFKEGHYEVGELESYIENVRSKLEDLQVSDHF